MAAEAAREAGREGALAVTVATNADAAELNQAVRALRVAAGEVGRQRRGRPAWTGPASAPATGW